MAGLIVQAQRKWEDLFLLADPRVEGWFMMSSPLPGLIICVLYVIVVKLGPSVMAHRKPIDIKNVLLVYNLGMVILSTYIFIEFLLSGWAVGYSLGCEPVDYSNSPAAVRMAATCWCFYISKFIELFDTIFFIMRKKFNQVTFLHVFHHGIMPVSWWFGVKFVPGGLGTFHSLLNSFIHLMMYTYYGLAALGPQYQKYLWWKKYMTKMQLTQFILSLVHAMQLFFIDCDYPILFAYWIALYAGIFFILFADFYRKAYFSHHKSKPETNGMSQNGIKDKAQ